MKRAAIGVRAHSGWAAVVAVGIEASSRRSARRRVEPVVLARERVSVVDPAMCGEGIRGAVQPYHHVEEWKIPAAEKYLAECAAIGQKMAAAALHKMGQELNARGYTVTGCAVLTGQGRPMPGLAQILAAHPLIHTAEGIFFRHVFQDACERLGWRVLGVREKELDEQAKLVLGKDAARAKHTIAGMGKRMGAPWTADQKMAVLAAWMTLAGA
ncbi:MAG: hypothetical protein WAM91_05595 [Candidatus Acidiferrales bacterium]